MPRSLRCVAGAPQTARKKKPATPVGMTDSEKRRAARPVKPFGVHNAHLGRRSLQLQGKKERGEEHRLKPVLPGVDQVWMMLLRMA